MTLSRNASATQKANREVKVQVYEDHKIADCGRNTLRLRRLTWGAGETEAQAKWDLRKWGTDKETGEEKALKGVSLSNDELISLVEFCKGIDIE